MQPINLVFGTVFALLHMQISLPREWLDWFEQGNEYEPAPGKVYRHSYYHNGVCWSHGNFVARKKRTGWLSFLPAARTLFFFELAGTKDFNGIVTCTHLGMLYFFLDASSLLFLFYTTHLSCMYSLEEDQYSCDLICLHFFILLYKQTSWVPLQLHCNAFCIN